MRRFRTARRDNGGAGLNIEDEISAFGESLDQALIANDAVALAALYHDDWVFIDPAGPTTKADLIRWIASGQLEHHTMGTIGPTRIVSYGGVAISTARRATSGSWEGTAYTTDEWMTEVYVRDGGAWRCVITQKCPADDRGNESAS
jgi:ketosteroid isomerase-like protein